jgi:hypothetical protein
MKFLLTFATFLFFIFPNKETSKISKTPSKVVAPPPLDCVTPTSNVEKIVCLSNAFKATLTASQITTLEIPLTATSQAKWSNFPLFFVARNGLTFGTLTAVQSTAALEIIKAASGTKANEGADELAQIRAGDTYTGINQGNTSQFSATNYTIAFLGTPSLTGKWMLQFGGHHYAQNILFNAGKIVGVTPSHQGTDPLTFTNTSGTFSPMKEDHAGMAAMLGSLTTAQLATAKSASSFGDLVLGPGKDNQFPATKLGLRCNILTAAQKTLVVAAMKPWLQDIEDAAGATMLTVYENELNDTYIYYGGNATLSASNDYVRIDGPSVWIEFYMTGGHYHTIYRDHTRDYGASGALTGTKEIVGINAQCQLGASYPNPFNQSTTIPFTLKNAAKVTLKIFDLLGREIAVLVNENRSAGNQTIVINNCGNSVKLNQGTYMYQLIVENNSGKFSQSKLLIVQ